LRAKESARNIISLDEETAAEVADSKPGPNVLAVQNSTKLRIREALEALPLEFKTVIILREFDGFSYKEISDIVGIPLGTVMSRLSRARQQLAILLQKESGVSRHRVLTISSISRANQNDQRSAKRPAISGVSR
jgi:RNA polymerase sigma-70 factor, ECF subfamily